MNFSLYRGDLHKVPDVPRRWPLPKPSIPLEVFQKALAKRREALCRLVDNSEQCHEHLIPDVQKRGENIGHEQRPTESMDCDEKGSIPGSHPNISADENDKKRKREGLCTLGVESVTDDGDLLNSKYVRARVKTECDEVKAEEMDVDTSDNRQLDMHEKAVSLRMSNNDSSMNETSQGKEKDVDKLEAPRTPAPKDEDCVKPNDRVATVSNDQSLEPCKDQSLEPCTTKRREELETRLKELQEKKHQLVQILKQVLIEEEESKKKAQDLEEGEFEYTQNASSPVVGSSHCSHFAYSHSQPTSGIVGRHPSSQMLNKQ